jgi:asparagine synthase (glutamine-hydrolysing)
MCGITGVLAYNMIGQFFQVNVQAAMDALEKRGPDDFDSVYEGLLGMGHRRLSILDTSRAGRQPMKDASGRFTLVYNGEIFNFKELRARVETRGIVLKSQSDTEVLVNLFALEGAHCLHLLNGFFAFAIYDSQEETLVLARDRFGVKPLLWYADEDKFLFASEMKSLMAYGFPREIDRASLIQYLQLNYIPAPYTIFQNVHKLAPGHLLRVYKRKVEIQQWYKLEPKLNRILSYEDAQHQLESLLEDAVHRRLIADVPLGAFLSGGIDSSAVVALASRHTPHLNTFSIGYRDEPFFDETRYAQLVAKAFHTEHTVFSLSNDDLYEHLFDMLDYTDEPFADSSALAVYILSKKVRKRVTVALSGDGADEIFGGYHKHAAEYRVRHPGLTENLVIALRGLWKQLPQSRHSAFGNRIRQLAKFAQISALPYKERYWRLATYADQGQSLDLLKDKLGEGPLQAQTRRQGQLAQLLETDFNTFLLTDVNLVLAGDMLQKVDLMSMANSLEVRNPFLDYEVVEFAFSLPEHFKVSGNIKKKILQDTFRKILPRELYKRPKQGFEVPLLNWMKGELSRLIDKELLSEEWILEQGLFDYKAIHALKTQLHSASPGDSVARIWGLLVFQYWWKQHMQKSVKDS